jgi:hypothetical protein
MNELFVNYQQAVALKELGFHETCLATYSGETFDSSVQFQNDDYFTAAPLFSQAFRWFREKHNLFGCIDLSNSTPPYWWMRIDDIITNDYVYHCLDDKLNYPTYEAAEQACLTKLIEIVQNKEV